MTAKQKLRPWLEGQLNRGEIEGVEWIDREKKIFKLPWKHGGKSDWNPLDSELFKVFDIKMYISTARTKFLCLKNVYGLMWK